MSAVFRACPLMGLVLALSLLGGAPAFGQPGNAEAAWKVLNDDGVEAYSRGEYAKGALSAEQALDLARRTFGARDKRTLTSMVTLANLYLRQGRPDEASALLRDALHLMQEVLGPKHRNTLTLTSWLGSLYESQLRYGEAESLYREARRLTQEVLGAIHPDTLASINNLANLYAKQRRFGEAEPLYREVLQLRRKALGSKHLDTLVSMNNLANLYAKQGRFEEAEPLARETLQLRREALGRKHADTLTSMSSLGLLYQSRGRYGEAEPLYREALQVMQEVLGPKHPDTVVGMNNLASLYATQQRYGDAEPLYREALQLMQEELGPRHPRTLTSMNNLAYLYASQERYGEAEPLYREALQVMQEVLGPKHPDTVVGMNNLASLYATQQRYGDAEPLYREALQLMQEELGPRHPRTLTSMNNLAYLYASQERYGEAEPLYREALEDARDALGVAHPTTLQLQLNTSMNLAAHGRIEAAVQQLQAMEPQILTWLWTELYTSEAPGVRRQLLTSQSTFQDVAISLALRLGVVPEARVLAASAVLRFKGLQAEEEASIASIARRGDSQARSLAGEIATLRSRLAQTFQSSTGNEEKASAAGPEALSAITRVLESKELALGRVSRTYAKQLQVRNVNLGDLRASLPPRTGLLEIREYRPADFRTASRRDPRWAGILVVKPDELRVIDLGSVADSRRAVEVLLREPIGVSGQEAARDLYQQLIAPLARELAGLERLYIAPDGVLYLTPFAALRSPDGKRLAEQIDVRLLQTGRDLLRPPSDRPARGLIALGGIDFDSLSSPQQRSKAKGKAQSKAGPPQRAWRSNQSQNKATQAPEVVVASTSAAADPVRSAFRAEHVRSLTREALGGGFRPLPNSEDEVAAIARRYQVFRRNEPVEVWTGAEASEGRLRELSHPPRVLHLATHGFYRAPTEPQDRPMLLSGVALAGANRALHESEQDGTLYAIEAQDLNLEGTELVVLSACETAQGQVDYGEGVSGLVRALRTAGARYVLVTLQPIGDASAGEFMGRFYHHWLSQTRSDPAAALRAAQLEYISSSDPDRASRPIWAQFILVGG